MSRRRDLPLSRLGEYMRAKRIRPMRLAVCSGVSRTYISRLEYGLSEPTRPMMVQITRAAREITKLPVRVDELFDLGT